MKVLVFYRPESEHARRAEEFMRELLRQHDISPKNIETVSIDTREGASLASLYDVVAYPGVVVVDSFGAYIKSWSGDLPMMDEVMSYAFSFGGA